MPISDQKPYTVRFVVDALRRLNDLELSGTALERALVEALPALTIDMFSRAVALMEFEDEEEAAKEERQVLWVQTVLHHFGKGARPATTVGDMLRQGAARRGKLGRWAKEQLAILESPDHRTDWALSLAAARMHPGWQVIRGGISRKDSASGPETVEALVEWFQTTHPDAAKWVEDRARSGA